MWAKRGGWLVLALLSVGCVCVTLIPWTQPEGAYTPTPQQLGLSRALPHPAGVRVVTSDWTLEVLHVIRGEEAWRRLYAANSLNDPPPEGWEYLLLELTVKFRAKDRDKESLGLYVTGDGGVFYDGFAAVPPEPRLDVDFTPGASNTGWHAFSIPQDEAALLLAFFSMQKMDAPYYYVALEAGARHLVDFSLEELRPTDLGTTLTSPASLGSTVTTEDWQVTVERVLWDEVAWEALIEANYLNEPPAENRRYLLVEVRVRYIGIVEGPEILGGYDFRVTGSDGAMYRPPALVEPKPALDAYLFPGGEVTGWIALETDRFADSPVLIFDPSYRESEIRYLALMP
ncbi:MAG: hypothetical protein ACP5HM_08760 [Anaerolineae bacterium]